MHIPTTSAYKDLLWRQARGISKEFLVAREKLEPLSNDPKRRSIEAAADRARGKAILRGQYIDLG